MFTSISAYTGKRKSEAQNTVRMLEMLTDASLAQEITENDRTLGSVAWHITLSVSEMTEFIDLSLTGLAKDAHRPDSARQIANAYREAIDEHVSQVKESWTDGDLETLHKFYGGENRRGDTLLVYLLHEIHHRGEMVVLMRQAGLKAPGIYGPTREDFVKRGWEPRWP